uniref:Uncharacterized protein n=1 Tax=Cacopsylla melanoneura TaxID=428564 RepID=A0A8D9F4F1_9HEMI
MVARSNIFDLAGRSATTLLNTLTTPGVPPVGHSCLYVMDRHRWYIRVCTEWTGCTTGEHLTLPTSILRVPPMVHVFECKDVLYHIALFAYRACFQSIVPEVKLQGFSFQPGFHIMLHSRYW